MALIAPTVEAIGDAALTNSIIDKSITEIQDNVVTRLRDSAMSHCTALKKAVFGELTGPQGNSIFSGCTALETVDFHQNVTIGSYSFSGCTALKALILRSTTLCETTALAPMEESGIASGNGYIYVPAALVDAYKAHSGWGQYVGQIRAIEDYPSIGDPYSWAGVAEAIENGTYKDVYKIGDEVPVDLGSEGVINMQIAAFDAEPLADGSGTAAISWIAKELLKTSRRMHNKGATYNSSDKTFADGSVGGWESCEMRTTYLANTIKPLIPANVSALIQPVLKTQTSKTTSGSSVSQTTTDEIWLPAKEEVDAASRIYGALFPNATSLVKCTTGSSTATRWWLRDATSTAYYYSQVEANGSTDVGLVTDVEGVCLGFCTGRTPT